MVLPYSLLQVPLMRPKRRENLPVFIIVLVCTFLVFMPVIGSPVTAARSLQPEPLNPNAYIVVTPLTTTQPPMVKCDAPCACMLPSEAEAQWGSGGYTRCSELPCARQLITSVAVVPVTKYCYRSDTFAVIETNIVRQRTCSAGLVSCNGLCVALDSDPNNCGSCGHSCSASQVCTNGRCRDQMAELSGIAAVTSCSACLPNQSCCSGKCADLQNDLANCGSCGTTCPGTPPQVVCDRGHCVNPCIYLGTYKGMTDCGGYCVNTLGSDPNNCGGCGDTCPSGENCCFGTCSNPLKDASNCGGCMKPCYSYETCCSGTCRDTLHDVSNCGGCYRTCSLDSGCCEGNCTDLQEDKTSCGSCGNACPPRADCRIGICACTWIGQTMCNGKCVSTNSDPVNCGSCGNACPSLQACSGGRCINLCDADPSAMDSFSWADWQGKNWMSPVKDQGACGSCWAFGPVGAAEAMYNIEHGTHKNIDLAEQELVSPCFGNGDAGDCLKGGVCKAIIRVHEYGRACYGIGVPVPVPQCNKECPQPGRSQPDPSGVYRAGEPLQHPPDLPGQQPRDPAMGGFIRETGKCKRQGCEKSAPLSRSASY